MNIETQLQNLMQQVQRIASVVAPDTSGIDFFQEADEHINQLTAQGRASTATFYRRSLTHLRKFCRNGRLSLDELTPEFIQKFIDHLSLSVSADTAKAYAVDIRVLYNKCARRHNLTQNPFKFCDLARHSGRGLRALTSAQIRALASLSGLPDGAAFARDLFLISFCLGGINFCDLLTLGKPRGGHFYYNRQKTAARRVDGARVCVPATPSACALAAPYLSASSRWLCLGDRYSNAKALVKFVNRHLKICAQMAGLPPTLSTYYARHSFASIARNECGIDIFDISQCLGHVMPVAKIDFIYIREDSSRVDSAINKVVDLVFNSSTPLHIAI